MIKLKKVKRNIDDKIKIHLNVNVYTVNLIFKHLYRNDFVIIVEY